jgi:hypothetical protein
MIPDFDVHGLLPEGVHDCSLEEIRKRFCWNPRRLGLLEDFLRFMRTEWPSSYPPCPIFIDGSFVRNKEHPNDLDIAFDISGYAPQQAAEIIGYMALHAKKWKQDYNLDVWPKHPCIRNDLTAFFQYLGEKAAGELSLPVLRPKGILMIREWS